jgi:hypothetical protein
MSYLVDLKNITCNQQGSKSVYKNRTFHNLYSYVLEQYQPFGSDVTVRIFVTLRDTLGFDHRTKIYKSMAILSNVTYCANTQNYRKEENSFDSNTDLTRQAMNV